MRLQVISDHMLMIKWKAKEGWGAPEIVASGPIGLHPFSHVFHYAIEVHHPAPPGYSSLVRIRICLSLPSLDSPTHPTNVQQHDVSLLSPAPAPAGWWVSQLRGG